MTNESIPEIIKLLKEQYKRFEEPIVSRIAYERNPFKVLIATIISLRTKDAVTKEASLKLLKKASTPREILKLSATEIEKLIYPAGFYKTKALTILNVCDTLINDYAGNVPDDIDELMKLKGVGRKTANLVVTLGFGKLGICVDTHVHRISNRFGYVNTKTPDATEFALRDKLPQKYWIVYNDLLVSYGQNLCKPISPFCSRCVISGLCERVGVERSR